MMSTTIMHSFNNSYTMRSIIAKGLSEAVPYTRQDIQLLRKHCILPLKGIGTDYDTLLRNIDESTNVVCIGEASHGTHEFYKERAMITRRLVTERGFNAIAWEADWPDAWEVNRFVHGDVPSTMNTIDCLSNFARFPQWMWRNTAILEFVGWLREYNDSLFLSSSSSSSSSSLPPPHNKKVSIFGLDLYSMYASIEAVIDYLENTDPSLGTEARNYYSCFYHPSYHEDSQLYGKYTSLKLTPSCENSCIEVLKLLQQQRLQRIQNRMANEAQGTVTGEGSSETATLSSSSSSFSSSIPFVTVAAPSPPSKSISDDYRFYAEQNAEIVMDAETYYREMFRGRINSWNLRDMHMVKTLCNILIHLDRTLNPSNTEPSVASTTDPTGVPSSVNPKIIVWAHNSHIGDARATEMHQRGEYNIGQLLRQPLIIQNTLRKQQSMYHNLSQRSTTLVSSSSSSSSSAHTSSSSSLESLQVPFPILRPYLIGFSTYKGTVTAASKWDGSTERKTIRPGLSQSYEDLFHQICTYTEPNDDGESSTSTKSIINYDHEPVPRFVIHFRPPSSYYHSESTGTTPSSIMMNPQQVANVPETQPIITTTATYDTVHRTRIIEHHNIAMDILKPSRLQRAIGVIYRPETERYSHYFLSSIVHQYDTLIHIDHTRALEPLERSPLWKTGEVEETYPTGL